MTDLLEVLIMFELRPYNRKNNAVYNPFRDMDEWEKQFFGVPLAFFGSNGMEELEADLPGFDKKDITLDVNGDVLTVRAERHSEHEEKDKKEKYVRCERSYGVYSREFDLTGIRADEIHAKYENGVLKLTLPKLTETKPEARRLEIE